MYVRHYSIDCLRLKLERLVIPSMLRVSSSYMIWTSKLLALARVNFHSIHLHRDGFWAPEEIEAIYGVHHIYSQKQSKVNRLLHIVFLFKR